MFASHVYPSFRAEGENLRVIVQGEIDHHGAEPLREEIDCAAKRYRPKALLLDLSGVTFMDSSGLGFVLGRIAMAEELGCRLEIWNASDGVLRILRMAGLHKRKEVILRRAEEPVKK